MPQDPRPRLQPVASPTDPFVAPGLAQPKLPLGGANFEALRGLSKTLNDFALSELQNQEAISQQNRQDAADVKATNEDALATMDRDTLQIINKGDTYTVDQLKQLRDAGVRAEDNPIAILNLKKAAAVYQVKTNDYSGFLRDPQFFASNSRKAMFESEEAANADLAARREQFMARLDIQGATPMMKNAIASELKLTEVSFLKERADQRARIFAQENERMIAVAVQRPIAEGLNAHLDSKESEAALKATVSSFKGVLQEQDLIGNHEGAVDTFLRQLEGGLGDKVDLEGDSVLHALDVIEAELGMPELGPRFNDLHAKLQSAVDRRDSRHNKDLPEARVTAQTKLENLIFEQTKGGKTFSSGELREFVFSGPGADLINSVAKDFKMDPNLLGNIRESVISNWTEREDTKKSNPELVRQVQGLIFEGKVDEAAILVAKAEPTLLTNSDQYRFYQDITQARLRKSTDVAIKADRKDSFDGLISSQGPLPPEAGNLMKDIQGAFDRAYNTYIDEHPNDIGGAFSAGAAAAQATPNFKELKALQDSIGFERLRSTGEYERSINQQVERVLLGQEQALKDLSTSGVVDPRSTFNRNSKIRAGMDEEMRSYYDKVSKEVEADPSITTQLGRNSAIMGKMASYLPKAFDKVSGLGPTAQKTQATASITSDTTLLQMEANRIETPAKVKQFTPVGSDNGTFFPGAFSTGMLRIQEYLDLLISKDEKPFFFTGDTLNRLNQGPVTKLENAALYSRDMVNILSARLVDGFYPQNSQAAGGRYGEMLMGSPRSREEFLNAFKGAVITAGMTPKEAITGQLRTGAKLQDIFGTDSLSWSQAAPVQMIPFFLTEEEVAQARTEASEDPESTGAQLMIAVGLDPTSKDAVGKFYDWQQALVRKRGFRKESLKQMQDYYTSGPADRPGDPAWLKKVNERSRNFFMEK